MHSCAPVGHHRLQVKLEIHKQKMHVIFAPLCHFLVFFWTAREGEKPKGYNINIKKKIEKKKKRRGILIFSKWD